MTASLNIPTYGQTYASSSNRAQNLTEDRENAASAASTVSYGLGRPSWVRAAQEKLDRSATLTPHVQGKTVHRAKAFVASLPSWTPEPFIAIGDAGIADIEWDSPSGTLLLSIDSDDFEACWQGKDGSEWEDSSESSPRLRATLARIAWLT